jgi:hypothetical protein
MNKPDKDRDLYKDWSDYQLVENATAGSPTHAELNRRFMDATKESSRRLETSSQRLETLTRSLIGLTVVLVVLTLVIVGLTIVLVNQEP